MSIARQLLFLYYQNQEFLSLVHCTHTFINFYIHKSDLPKTFNLGKMQITVFASLTALFFSLPIHGLPHLTGTELLKRIPTEQTINARTATAAAVDNPNTPQRRAAAPLGSICRENPDAYPEYCTFADPAEEAEEDDAITDDQLSNDQTGYNGR